MLVIFIYHIILLLFIVIFIALVFLVFCGPKAHWALLFPVAQRTKARPNYGPHNSEPNTGQEAQAGLAKFGSRQAHDASSVSFLFFAIHANAHVNLLRFLPPAFIPHEAHAWSSHQLQ